MKERLKSFLKKILWAISPGYRRSVQMSAREERLQKRLERAKEDQSIAEVVFWLQKNRPGETLEETKRRVFLEMPEWGGDFSRIQEGNFYLMKRLRQICGEQGLSFWMIGGTLLGAVRHKGFIPWDDDVDFGMMREDLEALERAMGSYPDLRLQRYFNNAVNNAVQVVKLTLAREDSPFWVDIMCYDYLGDGSTPPEALWEKVSAVRDAQLREFRTRRSQLGHYQDEAPVGEARSLIDGIFEKYRKRLPPVTERQYIYRSLDCVCGKWQSPLPVERMLPLCQLEFRGERFPAPRCWEWYLQKQYGDYLSLPGNIGRTHQDFLAGRRESVQQALEQIRALEADAPAPGGERKDK